MFSAWLGCPDFFNPAVFVSFHPRLWIWWYTFHNQSIVNILHSPIIDQHLSPTDLEHWWILSFFQCGRIPWIFNLTVVVSSHARLSIQWYIFHNQSVIHILSTALLVRCRVRQQACSVPSDTLVFCRISKSYSTLLNYLSTERKHCWALWSEFFFFIVVWKPNHSPNFELSILCLTSCKAISIQRCATIYHNP